FDCAINDVEKRYPSVQSYNVVISYDKIHSCVANFDTRCAAFDLQPIYQVRVDRATVALRYSVSWRELRIVRDRNAGMRSVWEVGYAEVVLVGPGEIGL